MTTGDFLDKFGCYRTMGPVPNKPKPDVQLVGKRPLTCLSPLVFSMRSCKVVDFMALYFPLNGEEGKKSAEHPKNITSRAEFCLLIVGWQKTQKQPATVLQIMVITVNSWSIYHVNLMRQQSNPHFFLTIWTSATESTTKALFESKQNINIWPIYLNLVRHTDTQTNIILLYYTIWTPLSLSPFTFLVYRWCNMIMRVVFIAVSGCFPSTGRLLQDSADCTDEVGTE